MSAELIFILIFLLAFVILIFIIIVMFAVIYYVGSRDLSEKLKIWKELADAVGLKTIPRKKGFSFTDTHFRMAGNYNDLEVEIKPISVCLQEATGGEYTQNKSIHCLCCIVKFPHPLNLSLNLQSPKAIPSVANLNNIIIGNPVFDSRFDAVCVNQEVLQKLLLNKNYSDDKNLLDEILQANHYIENANRQEIENAINSTPKYLRGFWRSLTYHLFIITDRDVTIKINCDFEDFSEKSIKQIMDQTTYIAKQIYDARLNLN